MGLHRSMPALIVLQTLEKFMEHRIARVGPIEMGLRLNARRRHGKRLVHPKKVCDVGMRIERLPPLRMPVHAETCDELFRHGIRIWNHHVSRKQEIKHEELLAISLHSGDTRSRWYKVNEASDAPDGEVTAMKLLRMDHFTIVSNCRVETLAFYQMLGFQAGPRPDFPVPGLWLYIGGEPILHVIWTDGAPRPARGVLDHMAFAATGLSETAARLTNHHVGYRIIRSPGLDRRWQMFFKDPNGAEVELDFAADEVPPAALNTQNRKSPSA